jgi:hypothetical protein
MMPGNSARPRHRVIAGVIIRTTIFLSSTFAVATEPPEEFDALRARANQLAATEEGKKYDGQFSDSETFAKPLQTALKDCTANPQPPHTVNLVLLVNPDGTLKRILPGSSQPVAECIAAKLKDARVPAPPGPEWVVALNIAIKGVAAPQELAPTQDLGPGPAPTEFVTQILEPTGGKLLRPKDWFYTESHNESSYTWIISREDASKARYTTGIRIQMIVGVKKGTGKTPKKFVLDYIAQKKKEAAKVVSSCGETTQDMFTRVCLETEEGPYHILYSMFWNNKVDWVIGTTAGTRKDLWSTFDPTFQKIGRFELIDLKRFQDEKKHPPN